MSLATFSPPVKATCETDSLSRVMLAISDGWAEHGPLYLCIDPEGRLEWIEGHLLIVDLRYDPVTTIWTDPTIEGVPDDD